MTFDVELSEQAKTLLEELYRDDRRSSRELALLVLRLEKDPRQSIWFLPVNLGARFVYKNWHAGGHASVRKDSPQDLHLL